MFDLSLIDWKATRHRGVFLHTLRRDRATNDATVLIRMQPGCSYPAHRHVGIEEVLILQGGYRDETGEHLAGQYLINQPGTSHSPVALDENEDCIMLAITRGGIERTTNDEG